MSHVSTSWSWWIPVERNERKFLWFHMVCEKGLGNTEDGGSVRKISRWLARENEFIRHNVIIKQECTSAKRFLCPDPPTRRDSHKLTSWPSRALILVVFSISLCSLKTAPGALWTFSEILTIQNRFSPVGKAHDAHNVKSGASQFSTFSSAVNYANCFGRFRRKFIQHMDSETIIKRIWITIRLEAPRCENLQRLRSSLESFLSSSTFRRQMLSTLAHSQLRDPCLFSHKMQLNPARFGFLPKVWE